MDLQGYYECIDHFLLVEKLPEYIKDKFILNLLWQFLHRMVDQGGQYEEIPRGISRGCPLSPLIGAFFSPLWMRSASMMAFSMSAIWMMF